MILINHLKSNRQAYDIVTPNNFNFGFMVKIVSHGIMCACNYFAPDQCPVALKSEHSIFNMVRVRKPNRGIIFRVKLNIFLNMPAPTLEYNVINHFCGATIFTAYLELKCRKLLLPG